MTNDTTASLLKIGSAACIVALGACVHAAAAEVTIVQVMAFRAAVSLVLILAWGVLSGQARRMRPRNPRAHISRAILSAMAMYLVYSAYASLPVALAQTVVYIAPILTLPFAAFFLREPMTLRLIAAVGAGFVGVVIVLGVSAGIGEAALWGALAGVLSAIMIAAIQVKIRSMMATETPISVALSFSVIVTLIALPVAILIGWEPVSWTTAGWLILAGVFGAGTLILNTEAVARMDVSRLAPLEYTGLLFALTLDWVIFGYAPQWLALLGAAFIVGGAWLAMVKRG